MENLKYTNEQIEEIINWTLPGLTMYYRDTELSTDIIKKYELEQIFRSQTFVDVSDFAGRLTKSCRFIFATSKAAPLYQINQDTEKWKLHTINLNSYFKVLDIYNKDEKVQILLLHIPAKAVDFFKNSVLNLGGQNVEEQIVKRARASFDNKMLTDIIPELEEQEWIDRTDFPIGLDNNNNFFPLLPIEKVVPQILPLYNAIVKITNDTDLNTTIN